MPDVQRFPTVRAPRRPEAPLAVVVADDHPLFRAGIVRALAEDHRFSVTGQAGDGPTAERMIRELDPDIALLDLRMPGADGLEILARLRHRDPPVIAVVLSSYCEPSLVHSAMAAGAAGYVSKETEREAILQLLVDVAAGQRRVLVAADGQFPRPRLAARERAVLSMLNRGWAPEEVAMLEDMTLKTLGAHVANARRKLGAATTQDAIAAAAAWGLLS